MNGGNNRRVLIVDDNRAIHDDIRKILCPASATNPEMDAIESSLFGDAAPAVESNPFSVASAYQGQDGLQAVVRARADDRPFAVAFMDVRMPPGWDGIQTTREIWKVDPEIQIIICTAYSDYSWDTMVSQLGHSDRVVVLKKPFDNIEVLQLAHSLTAKWELARQVQRRVDELDNLVAQRTEQLSSANKKLLEDISIQKQTELRLNIFAALGKHLSTAEDVHAAAQIIVNAADQLIGWDSCVCDLYSAADDRVHHVLNVDIVDGVKKECGVEHTNHKPSGLAQKAIHQGGQLILRENPVAAFTDSLPFGNKSRPSASILYVPIRDGVSVIGVLSIQSYKINAYDQPHLDTLQALADHCAGALNRIKTEEALRHAEQQLRQAQKMEAVGQLAGGVAHDFNNLLTVIIGNAQFISGDLEPGARETQECLAQLIDAANRAAKLTRQLLAFGRKQIVQAKPLDLNQLIPNLCTMLKRLIGEHIRLECTYAQNLPLVLADPSMIDQVIMNLAINSRDAMPLGGCLRIATQQVELDGSTCQPDGENRVGQFARISVSDTGSGISPKNLSHIFEPFFTTKDVGKGTGLGLATVFGIVKQHHGWVEVESELGLGTTFQIYFPALESEAKPI
jgi:signal transduction histidine kinase/DNA-binding NarL/FixJ family response regulator